MSISFDFHYAALLYAHELNSIKNQSLIIEFMIRTIMIAMYSMDGVYVRIWGEFDHFRSNPNLRFAFPIIVCSCRANGIRSIHVWINSRVVFACMVLL